MLVDQEVAREIASKGEKIYADTIKPNINLEEERGKFVVIDVNTGDYEIDKRNVTASLRLQERQPDGVLYGIRIGFAAAYKMPRRYHLPKDD